MVGRCSGVLSAAKREWEHPDPDSWLLPVVGAVVSILGILLLAGLMRDVVDLAYDESGNGCSSLTATSSRELAWAMAPVRVLLVLWVIGSALGLASKLSADAPERLSDTRKYAAVGAVFLSFALMLFVGIPDFIVAAIPWAVLALLTLAVFVLACLRAPASRGRWLWFSAVWLLATGILLPLALVTLTRPGEVPIC